ncbi:hypothetical protein L841_4335 [Mycobacterium sp. MAC_080597_8934]|nr:hypothetical protein L839_1071 [Mycobacterium avium MAV_120809_2495]ETZ60109.1 hypothetical protein L841_4335 [Mycobacterium sp. MAC_080597_8934]
MGYLVCKVIHIHKFSVSVDTDFHTYNRILQQFNNHVLVY